MFLLFGTLLIFAVFNQQAWVAELVDAPDSKSGGSDVVRVRVPSQVLLSHLIISQNLILL